MLSFSKLDPSFEATSWRLRTRRDDGYPFHDSLPSTRVAGLVRPSVSLGEPVSPPRIDNKRAEESPAAAEETSWRRRQSSGGGGGGSGFCSAPAFSSIISTG